MTRVPTLLALSLLSLGSLFGCSSKMEPKECDKIRGEAFDLVNKAQHCNTDVDCKQSEWPGCAHAVSTKTIETIAPMAESFKKGQCEETKLDVQAAARGLLQAGPLRAPREGRARGRGRSGRRHHHQVIGAS